MTIHKEGYKILFVSLLLLIGINWLLRVVVDINEMAVTSITIVSIGVFLFVLLFFRSPKRLILPDNTMVISPADGKVVVIEEVEETEYFNDRRIQVSVFMSPSNVHVNRNPISGIVKYIKYHPGKYLVAWNPKSSTKNERNTVVIEDNGIEVLFRQIAGILARRIVNYLEEGEEVEQGNEMGFIKFGSRIDLYLPLDAEILVDLKQNVVGGKTVIAKLS